MKYGLECEFFVVHPNATTKPIGALPFALTPDECGFLAEARGNAHLNIREAVFSLRADIYRLEREADKLGLILIQEPLMKVDRAEVLKSRRAFSKGVLSYQNLYGHAEHSNKNRKTAGIHISFTAPRQLFTSEGKPAGEINEIFDFVQMFRKLDAAFAEEIKAAGRKPGFYELKGDGRIEYRSLPNNVDFGKIIDVLSTS